MLINISTLYRELYVSAFIGANENFEKAAKSKSAINDSSNKAQDKSSLRDDVQKMESVRYWYPNMSKSEITYVRRIAKLELSTTDNYIDNENKWLYNVKNGNTYFALYSTLDVNEPTILYACKGKRAEFEHQFLSKSFEKEVDNNGDIYSRTKIIESILGKYEYVISGANVGNRNVVGGRSNNRNVGVYSKNSRIRPSEALLNCLRNIREIQKRNERNRLEQYSDRDTLSNTSTKAQNLLTNPLVDASNNFQDNKEQKNTADEGGVKMSEREKFAEYNKPITLDDIKVLRSIGRKSINAFTAEEVETAQKWAYKFYKQLGTKSPFFRRWFGDWRAHDVSPVSIADIPNYVATNEARKTQRGNVVNADTGWDIRISREGETNTISHSGDMRLSEYGLAGIRSLVENAVLLDSEVHEHHSNNATDDRIAFDHKLYALGIAENGSIGLYRITVEESYHDHKRTNEMKFHNLKYIEKVATVGGRTADQSLHGVSTVDNIATKYSVSDLYGFVKQYDKEFTSAPEVNPLFLNEDGTPEDGTPKVFYHGAKKNGGFTEFRSWQYFTDNKGYAERYAERENENSLYEVYLTANKIFDTRDAEAKSIFENIRQEYGLGELQDTGLPDWTDGYDISDYLEEHPELGYDAIILDEGGDLVNGKPVSRGESIVIKDSTQIKSATDNIGTFSDSEADIRYSDRDYSYDTLVSKPDMKLTVLSGNVPTNRADVVYYAKENAAKIGTRHKDGSVSVYVDDIDADVIITKKSLVHGLDRRMPVQAPVLFKVGDVLKNAIKINEMMPRSENVKNTYVLMGAARSIDGNIYVTSFVVNKHSNEITEIDVLYSVNAKKESAALLPKFTDKAATPTDSTISISKLLDYVNKYFPDILPESVLMHYGHTERPEGNLGKSALFSDRNLDMDNRTLLSNALVSTAQNEIEKKYIEQYQEYYNCIHCNE